MAVEKKSVKPSTELCLVVGCGKFRKCRGLCSSCYTVAKKLVKSGDTTWEKLESRKLSIVARSSVSKFMEAFKGK